MGVPIGRLICASNENNVLTDFIKTGTYDRNRPFYQTASPSMDILISSNLERLLSLLSGSDEEVRGYMQKLSETGRYTVSDRVLRAVQAEFSCGFCTDAQGRADHRQNIPREPLSARHAHCRGLHGSGHVPRRDRQSDADRRGIHGKPV